MNPPTEFIVLPSGLLAHIALPLGVLLRKRGNLHCVLECQGGACSLIGDALRSRGIQLMRMMDRVYFAVDLHGKMAGCEEFFDSIGAAYYELVDSDRNTRCANLLMELALQSTTSDLVGSVLDFGCGPGLVALGVQHLCGAIVGYDASAAMRELSHSNGLRILNCLAEVESGAFDCIIAVYVLHFGLSDECCSELYRVSKLGASLLGNCHKSVGLELLVGKLTTAGFSVREVDSCRMEFGPILMASKP